MTTKKVSTPQQPQIPFKSIDVNTHLTMSLKSFFSLIGVILGIFFGFYQIVIMPNQVKTDQNYNGIRADVKSQNAFMYEHFNEININLANLQNDVKNIQSQQNAANIKRMEIQKGVDKNTKLLKNNTYLDSIRNTLPFNIIPQTQNRSLNFTESTPTISN